MRKNVIKHIINILGLLLCITISFAWMLEIEVPHGRHVDFDFRDQLFVVPDDLEVTLYYEDSDGVRTDITDVYNSEGENSLLTFENFAPGDAKLFAVKLKNMSELDMNLAITFSDVFSEHDDFNKYVNIGLISTKGFSYPYIAPTIEDFFVSDRLKGSSMTLVDGVILPPNEHEVEIRFYIKLSEKATNASQNKEFRIGLINFIMA